MPLKQLIRALQSHSDSKKAAFAAKYFKTGPGQYGEGDQFLGLSVPVQRKIVHANLDLNLKEITQLLNSKIHEYRFTALEILVVQYEKASAAAQQKIVKFYLSQTRNINNWDLVDTSAPYILGAHLLTRRRAILYKLAKSKSLWERRIAIVATYALIRQNQFEDTLKIAQQLLKDKHDLVHKAAGWMLRDVGNRSRKTLENFLKKHAGKMPRTMLQYAIEKFEPATRAKYLAHGKTAKWWLTGRTRPKSLKTYR